MNKGLLALTAAACLTVAPVARTHVRPLDSPSAAATQLLADLHANAEGPWCCLIGGAQSAQRLGAELANSSGRIELSDTFPANKGRAVVPLARRAPDEELEDGEEPEPAEVFLHLLLEVDGDSWHLVRFDAEPKIAREWLYEHGKVGAEASGELAMAAFLIAARRGDIETAERVCTNDCWDGNNETARSIYHAARQGALQSSTEAVQRADDYKTGRAVAHMKLEVGDQKPVPLDFYLIRVDENWLIGGIGREEGHAERFLDGGLSANPWPRRPEEAAEHLAESFRRGFDFRVRAVSDESLHTAGGALEKIAAGLGTRFADVEIAQIERPYAGRCLAALGIMSSTGEEVGRVWIQLADTPAGWRVTEITPDEAEARAFYDGPIGR